MKILATLLIFGLFVHRSYGNCVLDGVSENTVHITDSASDTHTGPFRVFDTTNVISVSIESEATTGFPYMDVSYDADAETLTFFPKAAFATFEEEWPSATAAPTLTLSVQLQCEGSTPRSVSLHVEITDTNNHKPEFNSPTYEYKIPMPFPASVDVTQYGESIIVTDIDITNTRVEFSIEPEDFFIQYDGPMSGSNNKMHRAFLTAKKPLRFVEPQTYVMTVKDVGNPQESTTATIKIDIDEDNSVAQSPVFTEAFTIDEYKVGDINHDFYAEVTLSAGVNAKVELSGTYSGYFQPTNTDGIVSVALAENLPLDTIGAPFIVLTLTATLDNAESEAKIAIIITLPVDEDTTTTTECPTITCPTEAPTDPSTTECPLDCTQCPTDPSTTDCPTAPTDCPTSTDCPLDCTECPTDSSTTECPTCSTDPTTTECPVDCTECPTGPPTTECPTCPTECPTDPTTTDCPVDCTECPTDQSTTECPTDSTTTDCPVDCTECPTDQSTTECPTDSTTTDCPVDCTECPTDQSTTECPTDSTTTDCPVDCTECTTDPSTTECPTCPTECPTHPTTTDCPVDCTDCPTDPLTTECPTSPTDASTTAFPTCPTCPTEPSPTDCPVDCSECLDSTECPDVSTPEDCDCPTTIPPPAATITFDKSYLFEISPSDAIDITVEATSSISEEITYSTLEPMPNNLVLAPNGHLRSVGSLPTGSYGYTIVATGSTSKAEGSTELRIAVGSIGCSDECGMVAHYSLLVRNVQEEQASETLIPFIDDANIDYHFEIEGVVPNTDKICIDPDGNVVALKLDREASEFDNLNAQYTVTVRLREGSTITSTCPSTFSPLQEMLRITKAISEDQCPILEDISNEGDKIVVVVVVEDVNDHAPHFEPNNILIGYPEKNILSLVSPPYIMQAQATDEDIGINAELAYSIVGSDNRVIIHSDSGYVYPTDDLYNGDDLTFEVIATDKNGGQDGLSNTLSVTVKFLKDEHISVIAYKNQYLEAVDDILSRLSAQAEANIKYLTASVLPTNDLSRSARDTADYYLVIIAYAFRQNTLLTNGELEKLLADVDDLDISALPNTSGGGNNNNDDDDHTDTGLIAAVIVLAILLAIALIGFIALYILKFRKTENYSKMEEDGLSKSQTPDNTTPPQFVKNKSLSAGKVDVDVQMRRPTGIVFSSQFSDEDLSPTAPEEAMNDHLRDRRKSVAFNAEIEEISIERDAENEGEQDGEKKESNSKEQSAENTETSKL